MTYNVLMGTLNPTHSLTHSLRRYKVSDVLACELGFFWSSFGRDDAIND